VDPLREAERYFATWRLWLTNAAADGGLKPGWRDKQPRPPIPAMQVAAVSHPNARVRRDALNLLDHYANDESVLVFRAALQDPVPRVRVIALHGLACERCRADELCVADVVPALVDALESDPSPRVRHDVVPILLRLAGRDRRAADALRRAASNDPDDLVRAIAAAAIDRRTRDIRSRKALRRRARVSPVGSA
jgi:HEAT repeat protein